MRWIRFQKLLEMQVVLITINCRENIGIPDVGNNAYIRPHDFLSRYFERACRENRIFWISFIIVRHSWAIRRGCSHA